LMSGIPQEMRNKWIPPTKRSSRSKSNKKKILGVGVLTFLTIFFTLYYYEPTFRIEVDSFANDNYEWIYAKFREVREKLLNITSPSPSPTLTPTPSPTPSPTSTTSPSPSPSPSPRFHSGFPSPSPSPSPSPAPIPSPKPLSFNESEQINPMTGGYSPYINGTQYHYYLGLVKTSEGVVANSYGEFVVLINNEDAKNPSYSQLLKFLKSDKTDRYPYQFSIELMIPYFGSAEDHVDLDLIQKIIDGIEQPDPPKICADFATLLHNNAEKAGIRCAYVSIELGKDGHALNAFNTTDRGMVYIDDTGISRPGPSNCDKIVNVSIGGSYIPRSLFPEEGWSSTWENVGTVTNIFITWDGEWREPS